jgi:cystathionine gamma-lyase
LQPGDEVITGNDLYGGSYRIFTKIFANYGIKFHFLICPRDYQEYVNDKTKLVWIETPTNPTMQIVDIEAVGKSPKKKPAGGG